MSRRDPWEREFERALNAYEARTQARTKAKEIAQIQARYEAAYWSTSRSYLPGFVQSARTDVDSMSRTEILRRVRYFEKNSNVMQKALSILSVNVIGTGINPTPATAVEGWNKKALDWWNTWAEAADLSGTSNVGELQNIAYRAETIDGDGGIELTLNEFGRPAIDLVESHRITSAGIDVQKLHAAGYNVVDGVLIGPRGKPLAYMVADEFDGSKVRPIPASQFVFFFKKLRSGQYRGISEFHGAILDLHDLDDLQRFEMLAAKDAASISKVVQTASGASTIDGNPLGASLSPAPIPQTGQAQEYYRKALGGETIHTLPGDKVDLLKSDRPSAAVSGFWDKLENKFVQGSGLSYAALVDYRGNWGGATLRAAVTSDNRLFSMSTAKQSRKWQRVWEYAIGWAMDHGELPQNPDFRNVRWHPPRRTTVDIGHESDAMLNELKGGLRTYEGIYGEAGDDWRERIEQRAIEEKYIEDMATRYGIPRQYIASFAMERLTGIAPDAVAAAGGAAAGGGMPGANNSTPATPNNGKTG